MKYIPVIFLVLATIMTVLAGISLIDGSDKAQGEIIQALLYIVLSNQYRAES